MVVLKPSCREPAGRRSDLPYGVTAMPSTQYSILASCLRYLTRVFPLPVPAHSSHSEQPRFASLPRQPHPTSHHREGREAGGEAGMFRRDIRVSDAERGRVPCRSKEHTASTLPKRRTPHHLVRGSGRAADGLEGGNPERARECISAWKRFPLQTRKKPRDEVRGFWSG